jgi:hypothetical protein
VDLRLNSRLGPPSPATSDAAITRELPSRTLSLLPYGKIIRNDSDPVSCCLRSSICAVMLRGSSGRGLRSASPTMSLPHRTCFQRAMQVPWGCLRAPPREPENSLLKLVFRVTLKNRRINISLLQQFQMDVPILFIDPCKHLGPPQHLQGTLINSH